MAVKSVYPRPNNTSQKCGQMRCIQHTAFAQESSMDIAVALEEFEKRYVESANRRLSDLRDGLAEIRALREAVKNHTQSLREAA